MPAALNIQGHRGARGLYPENTLRSFIEAVRLGVHALEMDVVISADRHCVVSHEAWMNEEFCSLPDGAAIEKGNGKNYNLYRMTYAEIKQFDCGKRRNAEFPEQVTEPAYKPLLGEVIAHVENYTRKNKLAQVSYNIELKTEEGEIFNPPPGLFASLVYEELKKYDVSGRISLQSFDVKLLQAIRKIDPALRIGLLVENREGLEINLGRLGFLPQTYSPEFVLVNAALVAQVHRRGMKLIPWTVNEKPDMLSLIAMGVDGIITDYPDRLVELTGKSRDRGDS